MKEPFVTLVLAPGIGGAGTVTFTGLNLPLNQIESVYDCTAAVLLYRRGDPFHAQVGYVQGANSVMTLNNSTATLSASDSLIAYYEDLILVGTEVKIIADAQGTSATGINQLPGGAGILGWLSGIFSFGGTNATGVTAPSGATGILGWLSGIFSFGGTNATGVTPPAGATGILGWLSSIYNSLNTFIHVTISWPSSAGDTAISAGCIAQNLFGGATPANGFEITNPDPVYWLWVSDSTTAAPYAQGSIPIKPGDTYKTPDTYKPSHAVSIYGIVTGQAVTARSW